MEIGEFKYQPEDFNKLIQKEQDIIERFEKYCRQHNKVLESQILVSYYEPVLLILKFKIYGR